MAFSKVSTYQLPRINAFSVSSPNWSYVGIRDWTNRVAGNGMHRAACWIMVGFGTATVLYAATDGSADFYELAARSAYASGLLSFFYLSGAMINAFFPDSQDDDHRFVWNVAELFTAVTLKVPIAYAVGVLLMSQYS